MPNATKTAPSLLRDLRGKLGEGVFSVSEHLDNLRLLVPAARAIELLTELRDGFGYHLTELGGIEMILALHTEQRARNRRERCRDDGRRRAARGKSLIHAAFEIVTHSSANSAFTSRRTPPCERSSSR